MLAITLNANYFFASLYAVTAGRFSLVYIVQIITSCIMFTFILRSSPFRSRAVTSRTTTRLQECFMQLLNDFKQTPVSLKWVKSYEPVHLSETDGAEEQGLSYGLGYGGALVHGTAEIVAVL